MAITADSDSSGAGALAISADDPFAAGAGPDDGDGNLTAVNGSSLLGAFVALFAGFSVEGGAGENVIDVDVVTASFGSVTISSTRDVILNDDVTADIDVPPQVPS